MDEPLEDTIEHTIDYGLWPEWERLYGPQEEGGRHNAADNRGGRVSRLRRDAGRSAHHARDSLALVDPAALTLTIVIPAYNEEEGLPPTLESLRLQTVVAEKVIVVNDGSTDGTAEVAAKYSDWVQVVTHPTGSGSKAMAQNLALPYCDTDLILTVDADTVLRKDFIEEIKKPFADPLVSVASGNVQVLRRRGPHHKHTTMIERGREIEYLFGLHFYRPVQHMAGAPVVCSGCASALRTKALANVGGFPKGTVAEDMDYTHELMLKGQKAVYVTKAECYVQDPMTYRQLRTQVYRWMSGYAQNIRLHYREALRRKKMLALWMTLTLIDIISIPLWILSPIVGPFIFHTRVLTTVLYWLGTDLVMTMPVVAIGVVKRKVNPFWALISYPCIYINRCYNAWYAIKAASIELVFVPLGWAKGLQVFIKGH
jgi:cellulose synthase/poly-beta-1,6-N-acetylglucosamine synthase-like glycosyltransferase